MFAIKKEERENGFKLVEFGGQMYLREGRGEETISRTYCIKIVLNKKNLIKNNITFLYIQSRWSLNKMYNIWIFQTIVSKFKSLYTKKHI